MSAKNQLQEFFQKQKLPLPIYSIIRLGGPDHQPLWKASITYSYHNSTTTLEGHSFSNKGQATLDVAERVLKLLSESQSSIKIISPERTALFVDVENMPNFIDEVQQQIQGMIIYAFIGYHHCLAIRIWPDSNIIKILSHSTHPDGTDTAMQVYVGYHLAQNNYDRYYIATRDHYGSSLVEMITTQPGPWKLKSAHLVTQIAHLIQTLQ